MYKKRTISIAIIYSFLKPLANRIRGNISLIFMSDIHSHIAQNWFTMT